MLLRIEKQGAFVFTILLLCFCNLLQSKLLLDTSLQPRAFALALLMLVTLILLSKQKIQPNLDFWLVASFGFYLWNLLSGLWSNSPSEAFMQSQLIFLGITVYLAVRFFDTQKPEFSEYFIKTQIVVLLLSFAAAFFKIFNLTFFDPYQVHPVTMNNNLYACFLLLSLPLLLWGYSRLRSIWRFLSIFSLVLSLYFLVIAQSRAAYLGLGISLFLLTMLTVTRYREIFSWNNLLTGLLALMVLSGSLFIFYHSLDPIRKNAFLSKVAVWKYLERHSQDPGPLTYNKKEILPADNYPASGETPKSVIPVEYYENVNTRLIFWEKSLGLFKQRPFTGVGAGNWRFNVASVVLPRNPEYTIKNYTYSQPHNEWIAFLTELGIIGALLAMLVLVLPVFGVIIISFHGGNRLVPFESAVIACFLAGLFVFASFDFPFRRVEHIVLFFSLTAFMISRTPLAKQGMSILPEKFMSRMISCIVITLLALTLLMSLFRMKGEYYTRKIFAFEKSNDELVLKYSAKALNPFYAVTPNALPIDWFRGTAAFRKGENELALRSLESALESTPYEIRVINDYGVALYGDNRKPQAIEAFRYALSLDRDFDEAKFNLCAAYYSMGILDSALYYVSRCRSSQKKADYINEILLSAGK